MIRNKYMYKQVLSKMDYNPYILNENNITEYLKYKLQTDNPVKKQLDGQSKIQTILQQRTCFDSNIQSDPILNTKNIYSINSINSTIVSKKNDHGLNMNQNVENQAGIYTPLEGDTLFWCYYIIKNGELKYETLNYKNSLCEKNLKIDHIAIIRENKSIVKTHKFDSITNIESNLSNDAAVNIKTIMTLCAIENINLIYVSKKTYFEILLDDGEPIYIIHELPAHKSKYHKKYCFEKATDSILENIRENLYKVITLDKPLKCLSSYKVSELIDISNKLAIDIVHKETGKKKTKNELYESIIQYF